MTNYQPLQERAYEYIRQKILNGGFSYNVIYSETKLAQEIGISRTPVKDALVRLSQDRYIDILPSKGFCLHEMSREDVWSTYQTRTAIEGFCAMLLASQKDTPAARQVLHDLESSIKAMRAAIRNGETQEAVLAYDMHFHHVLVASSNNKEMQQLFECYYHRLYAIAVESFELPGRMEEALHEHEEIYTAIVDTQGENDMRAYQVVMHHMAASRDIGLQRHQ